MMITLRRRRRPTAELDMAPLMDVVFLLLLFFMLTSTFIEHRSIELRLPTSATAAGEAERALPRVQLLADGTLAIDGNIVSADQLKQQVRSQLSGRPEKELVLEADLRCSVQQMVRAMDRLRTAGADQVHLVTESER